jgi:hypothetical protein
VELPITLKLRFNLFFIELFTDNVYVYVYVYVYVVRWCAVFQTAATIMLAELIYIPHMQEHIIYG